MDLRIAYWSSLEEEIKQEIEQESANPAFGEPETLGRWLEQKDEILDELRTKIAKTKGFDELRLKAIDDRCLRDFFDCWPNNVNLYDAYVESPAQRVRILRHLDGLSSDELQELYEELLTEELAR